MAEYWKSLPRKFCDVCKCWFADNKASIDFHERGKRHQENAQKQIKDIQKRGIKEFKKQQELENEMEKIERAALAAYKKDLQNMQGGEKLLEDLQTTQKHFNASSKLSIKPKPVIKTAQKKQKVSIKTEQVPCPVPAEPLPLKFWYEAETEEGHKYYWHAETSESKWEPPEEGYVSIEEQNQVKSETVSEEPKDKSPERNPVKEEKAKEKDISSSIGPQPKVDPYGQWTTVEEEKPVEYDLQLPKLPENSIEVVIPVHSDAPSLKFKEKVIGQLSNTDCESSGVTFKKRKFTGSSRKNARQRTTDDD